MNSKSNHLIIKSVEKLVQIGRVTGNVNIHGNVEKAFFSVGNDLLDTMRKSAKPEESITDVIVKTADKFDEQELMSFDVGAKILFLLMIHPDPMIALDILSSRRPKADMNTLFWLLSPFAKFEIESNILKVFGYDRDERMKEIQRAFNATKTFKQAKAEAIPNEIVSKLVKEFMDAYISSGAAEYGYVISHPEIFSMSVDFFFASMAVQAFLKSDEKGLEHFMEIRQNFTRLRVNR